MGITEGSDLIPESQFNGMCKVLVEGERGEVRNQGTGFLFRFETDDGDEIRGLLTCSQLFQVHTQADQATPDPAMIFIEFPTNPVTRKRLAGIQKANSIPIFSHQHEVYFCEVSNEFCQEAANSNVPFYREADGLLDRQVWIAHYPGSSQERHVYSAMIDAGWSDTQKFNTHYLSTGAGSSGAPLLQYWADIHEMRVIGMHIGAHSTQACNIASSSKHIVRILKGMRIKPAFYILFLS